MIVLIPSYEPDGRLPQLVADLGSTAPVVLVDDGSGPAYGHVFAECARRGAVIVSHPENRGKGAALKSGFTYVATHFPGEAVVCADSDGQHSPVDILRVADELADGQADLVLGARLFTGEVPPRSRFGNSVTQRLFAAATRRRLIDTQTGLRAVPARTLAWLGSIPGDRFEYELRVLLRAVADGLTIREVEIATIYLDENASSHFRPVRDSLMIYRQLFAFVASSLVGFALDAALLFAGVAWTGNVTASAVGARLISGSANFTMNRRWVFRSGGIQAPLWRSVRRYAALAGVILAANVLLLHALSGLLGSLLLAKVGTEVTLFVASFLIQRTGVFAPTSTRSAPAGARETAGV